MDSQGPIRKTQLVETKKWGVDAVGSGSGFIWVRVRYGFKIGILDPNPGNQNYPIINQMFSPEGCKV
jgi:hypothetical protein